LIGCSSALYSQDDTVYKTADEMSRFPGCEGISLYEEDISKCSEQSLLEYIYGNLRYALEDRQNKIEGTTVVQFIIEKDGSVSNIKLARDIGGSCGANAVRVVEEMNSMQEKWRPAHIDGEPVRSYYTLPIRFKLERQSRKF
jgi:protein TonB